LASKIDRGEVHFMAKWNSPIQVFKYIHVYSHCSTNYAKLTGLEGFSSSTN